MSSYYLHEVASKDEDPIQLRDNQAIGDQLRPAYFYLVEGSLRRQASLNQDSDSHGRGSAFAGVTVNQEPIPVGKAVCMREYIPHVLLSRSCVPLYALGLDVAEAHDEMMRSEAWQVKPEVIPNEAYCYRGPPLAE